MTETQKQLARHALGLPNAKNFTYRNNFCTGKDSEHYVHWQDLVNKGLAVKREMGPEWCGDYFYLTFEAAREVLLPHEHISREDAVLMRKLS